MEYGLIGSYCGAEVRFEDIASGLLEPRFRIDDMQIGYKPTKQNVFVIKVITSGLRKLVATSRLPGIYSGSSELLRAPVNGYCRNPGSAWTEVDDNRR